MYIQNTSFYQDRLGTNIRKTPKKDRFSSGNQGGGIDITTAKMNDTSTPISISFEDITIVGGSKLPWMHPTACGISLTGHEHPHENVRGLLQMRNVHIR
jgi:hypothetical protein